MKKKVNNNEEFIEFPFAMPNNKGLVHLFEDVVYHQRTYIINIDDDVTEPFQYREISETLAQMTENDIAFWNINTYGGDLYTTVMLMDDIEQCNGKNIGKVVHGSSAGSILGCVMDECGVVPFGEMFLHEVQSHHFGGTSYQEKQLSFLRKQQDKIYKYVYKDFLTDEEIERLCKGEEFYLDAEDCNARFEKRRLLWAQETCKIEDKEKEVGEDE
jgi:ATP-dependent protease ClpP protease subunit